MSGILFNKGKTFIISCQQTMSEVYKAPDGAEKIGDCSFNLYVELISIAEWKSDREIEWGFDESKGRLITKGKLEDYRDGIKSSRMKGYPRDNPLGMRDTKDK